MNQKKILIVEDDRGMRILLTLALETSGYRVFQAKDGSEGLRLAEALKPDMIIADVVMPKMDGNQLLKEVRDKDFGKDIPFIVLTARKGMKDYFESMEVDGFIEKPFEGEMFIATVEEAFKKRGLKSQSQGNKDGGDAIITEKPDAAQISAGQLGDIGAAPLGVGGAGGAGGGGDAISSGEEYNIEEESKFLYKKKSEEESQVDQPEVSHRFEKPESIDTEEPSSDGQMPSTGDAPSDDQSKIDKVDEATVAWKEKESSGREDVPEKRRVIKKGVSVKWVIMVYGIAIAVFIMLHILNLCWFNNK